MPLAFQRASIWHTLETMQDVRDSANLDPSSTEYDYLRRHMVKNTSNRTEAVLFCPQVGDVRAVLLPEKVGAD